MLLLPGGVVSSNGIEREVYFKPLIGMVELAIAEEVASAAAWPKRISGVLAAAVRSIGTRPAEFDLMHDLAVGDRQFLVMMLGDVLSGNVTWVARTCPECGERFDVSVHNSSVPVKPAGASYPFTSVNIAALASPIRFRVPTGRDQEYFQSAGRGGDVRQLLARRLMTDDSVAQDVSFSDEDLDRIESAIEEVAPEVGTKAIADCPECRQQVAFQLDPYACLQHRGMQQIFEDVDRLARHYHWSETEILNLPRKRRRIYLQLVDRNRGRQNLHESPDSNYEVATP